MSKEVEQNRQDLWLRMQAYADNNKFEIDECVFYYEFTIKDLVAC